MLFRLLVKLYSTLHQNRFEKCSWRCRFLMRSVSGVGAWIVVSIATTRKLSFFVCCGNSASSNGSRSTHRRSKNTRWPNWRLRWASTCFRRRLFDRCFLTTYQIGSLAIATASITITIRLSNMIIKIRPQPRTIQFPH